MFIKSNHKYSDGLEEYVKDILEEMKPQTAEEWIKIIENTARHLCNDHDGTRINFRKRMFNYYSFEFEDKEALVCGINAITSFMDHMPIMQQLYYKKLLFKLEHEKKTYI